MRRPQLRLRSLIVLVLLFGLAFGFEAWRQRPVPGILDDPSDEAYVREYFKHTAAQKP